MKVYIAGRGDAEGIARWRALAALVREAGHTITYDWTVDVESERARGIQSWQRTQAERQDLASRDMKGVLDADVLIYDSPHEKSEGAAYELGAHHMKRDLIKYLAQMYPLLEAVLPVASIVVGDAKCLFASLSDYHAATNEDAIAALKLIETQDRAGSVVAAHLMARVS